MSVALALAATLIVAPSPAEPLTAAELAETLGQGWWCTRNVALRGCSSIARYDFERREIEECGGSDIAWIPNALARGTAGNLQTVAELRPLLESLHDKAEAEGYTTVKTCQTRAFRVEGAALCTTSWAIKGKPRMWLTRSGRWDAPDDPTISPADAERYWWFWPRMFAEEAGQDPDQGLKTDTEYCGRHTLRADGTLSQVYRVEGTVQSFVLTPLERLEDGVIVPWAVF
mgnify:CR=1 FL=1